MSDTPDTSAPTMRAWKPTTDIHVDLDKTGQWITLRTPYSAAFVQTLKSKIAHLHRRWDPAVKLWLVARSQWSAVLALLGEVYTNPKIIGSSTFEAQRFETFVKQAQTPELLDYDKLGVKTDSPACVIHAAYLALEVVWAGHSEMRVKEMGIYPRQEIKDAYQRICQSRGLFQLPPRALTAAFASVRASDLTGIDDVPSIDNPPSADPADMPLADKTLEELQDDDTEFVVWDDGL